MKFAITMKYSHSNGLRASGYGGSYTHVILHLIVVN